MKLWLLVGGGSEIMAVGECSSMVAVQLWLVVGWLWVVVAKLCLVVGGGSKIMAGHGWLWVVA